MSLNASTPTSLHSNFRYPPASRGRTGLRRCVLFMSILFVLGFCAVLLLIRSFLNGSNGSGCEGCINKHIPQNARFDSVQCREICTTEECIRTAADMINRMDVAVDPCHDFHRFSCGKYDRISMGKVKREQFMNDAAQQIIPVLAGMIQNIPKHIPKDIPGNSASKVRNFYDSCVRFHSTEEMAIPTILKYLEYFGIKNWPYLNPSYQFANPDLDEAISRLSLYEANVFFGYEIPENSGNILETNITEKSASDCALNIKVLSSRRTLISIPNSEADVSHITNSILDDFGLSLELINATVEDVFKFEEALDDIQKRSRKRIRKCTFNATISCSAYEFDCGEERSVEMERWCEIAVKVLNETGMRDKHEFFNVILEDKIYFKDVTALIDRTSHRTIGHALALQIFLKNIIAMDYRFRRITNTTGLLKELLEKFQDERKLLCATFTIIHLPALLGGVFYSKIYSGELQKEADEIYSDIQKYLVAHVRKMTWMDRYARESLEEQLWRVKLSLTNCLPYISDPSELDEFYEGLNVTDESFLSNIMEIRRFRYVAQILHHDNSTMVLRRERPQFQFNPNYQEDVIVMDFSSFIYPLISKNRPRYSNLGFFGSFLAHEFSHAVEIFLRDRENMSSTFESSLTEKKKCLIDQYSEYEMDLINIKVNGSITLHENMADFFSIRPTYQALKSFQEEHGIQQALPGLPFSEDQMFFISYAQWWCESNTPETMKQYIEDNHSPGKYRVLGMMRNFGPFSAAFNCPLGSPMNPIEKCDF